METTYTLEHIRELFNNPVVLREAERMIAEGNDYSTLPMFAGRIGMYNEVDGVWIVDTNDSCDMNAAIKLMRVL